MDTDKISTDTDWDGFVFDGGCLDSKVFEICDEIFIFKTIYFGAPN